MENEAIIRLGAFLGVFVLLATAEIFVPRRRLSTSKVRRWFANLAIVALNPLTVTLVYPILPIGLAVFASEQNWGLFNQLTMPYWLKVILGVVLLRRRRNHDSTDEFVEQPPIDEITTE